MSQKWGDIGHKCPFKAWVNEIVGDFLGARGNAASPAKFKMAARGPKMADGV